MAEIEINKPKTEKTSASVTSTLPRLCPTINHYSKDISCNRKEKIESSSQRNRPISDEIKKRSNLAESPKRNLHKSKLTEFKNSNRIRSINESLTSIPRRDYRSFIPIHNKHSLCPKGMSPPLTRSSSPLKKNSLKDKSSNKIKTITLEQDVKKKTKLGSSRSPSPIKKSTGSYRKTKDTALSGSLKNSEKSAAIKRIDEAHQSASPRSTSPTKRKPKTKVSSSSNVEFSPKEKVCKEIERKNCETDSVLKQASQPSLSKKDKIIHSKDKLNLENLKNEVYAGDHRRLSFEKVQVCIEQSLDNLSVAESKKSYLVTYSSENLNNQEEISQISFLQNLSCKSTSNFTKCENIDSKITESKNAIITVSGQELVLTPSIRLEMGKEETEGEPIKISELLHESGENFDELKDIRIFQDDANEYDSEVSTDGEISGRVLTSKVVSSSNDLCKKTTQSVWKESEVELLNDVDYRQSMYHPAVSRLHIDENENRDFRPTSKSNEDYDFNNKAKERLVQSRSSHFKNKYTTQCSTNDQEDIINDRPWCSSFDKTDGVPIYNTSVQDIPIYTSMAGIERIRTKKQRISSALLRFTLKIIRLLALFNLWPGDFCYMLTSQSLRVTRSTR